MISVGNVSGVEVQQCQECARFPYLILPLFERRGCALDVTRIFAVCFCVWYSRIRASRGESVTSCDKRNAIHCNTLISPNAAYCGANTFVLAVANSCSTAGSLCWSVSLAHPKDCVPTKVQLVLVVRPVLHVCTCHIALHSTYIQSIWTLIGRPIFNIRPLQSSMVSSQPPHPRFRS